MKLARGFQIIAAALVIASIASCGIFDGTSLEGKLDRLERDAQGLVKQIQKETDPTRKKTLERDLDKVKGNIQDLLKELARKGSKIDVKGFLDDLGDSIKSLGN